MDGLMMTPEEEKELEKILFFVGVMLGVLILYAVWHWIYGFIYT